MSLLCPTFTQNIKKLKVEFTHGYRPRASVFYVSTTNEIGEERFVKNMDTSNWGPLWTSVNHEFEAKLVLDPHLKSLYDCMFFICDGNHRISDEFD